MHRVITKFRDRNRQVIIEKGPWHPSRAVAEDWANQLRSVGYMVELESHGGFHEAGDNDDLMKALSSMA